MQQSSIYVNIICERMARHRASQANAEVEDTAPAITSAKGKKKAKGKGKRGAKNAKLDSFFGKAESVNADATSTSTSTSAALAAAANDNDGSKLGQHTELRSARQPKLITGGIMKDYQLEGLEWLVTLFENGLNGILADEMGLGKTLQTISFLAFLREKGIKGPFLVVGPVSVLSSWVDEIARWAPSLPAASPPV
jgi:ATP-dependent DNA helicase